MAQPSAATIPRLPWWIPPLLAAVVFAVYANALRAPFVMDDLQMIVRNEPLHQLWPPTSKLWADPASGTWARPVSAFTYAVNYAIGGERTLGYHLVNIALHIACALLLLGIVRRTLLLPQFQPNWRQRATPIASIIALLWAIHPLTTDGVTYLASRTELLFGLFLLLTLYLRLRGQLVLAVVACALGMGSKEPMVIAPILVLLYDGIFLQASPLKALRARPRFYLALFATWLILAALLLRPELAIRGETHSLSPWQYLKTQAGVIVHYLRLAIWPHPLSIDYFDWPIAQRLTDVLPAALLIVALLSLTMWGLLRRRPIAIAGAWVFLILAPTSSILPIGIEVATERRMYLPLMGIVAAAVIALAVLLPRRLHRLGIVAAGAVALILAALTVRRNEDYRDVVTITRSAIDARPNNARAWIAHGYALAEAGDMQSALGAFDQAVRVGPHYPKAWLARGTAFANVRLFDRAVADFQKAIQLDSQMPEPHLELGKVYLAAAQFTDAEGHFRRAIELYPQWRDPRTWLAGLLVQQNRLAEAEQLLAETLAQHPRATPVQQALRAVRAARQRQATTTTAPAPH